MPFVHMIPLLPQRRWMLGVLFAVQLAGCGGYLSSAELERQNRGPTACDEQCHRLGMRMGALVLVGDTVPACVCEPMRSAVQIASGASGGSTGGYVVVAAAAAAAQQQQQQLHARMQTVGAR